MVPRVSTGSACLELSALTSAISHVQHRRIICHAPRSRVVFLGVVMSLPLDGSPLIPRARDTRLPLTLEPRFANGIRGLIQPGMFAAHIAPMRLSSNE